MIRLRTLTGTCPDSSPLPLCLVRPLNNYFLKYYLRFVLVVAVAVIRMIIIVGRGTLISRLGNDAVVVSSLISKDLVEEEHTTFPLNSLCK